MACYGSPLFFDYFAALFVDGWLVGRLDDRRSSTLIVGRRFLNDDSQLLIVDLNTMKAARWSVFDDLHCKT